MRGINQKRISFNPVPLSGGKILSSPKILRKCIKLNFYSLFSDCSICLVQKESSPQTLRFFKVFSWFPQILSSTNNLFFFKLLLSSKKSRNDLSSSLLGMKEKNLSIGLWLGKRCIHCLCRGMVLCL